MEIDRIYLTSDYLFYSSSLRKEEKPSSIHTRKERYKDTQNGFQFLIIRIYSFIKKSNYKLKLSFQFYFEFLFFPEFERILGKMKTREFV